MLLFNYNNFLPSLTSFISIVNILTAKQQQLNNTINHVQQDANDLGNNFKRVCYFRMDPKTEIQLNQVDGSLCTHLILAFFRIDDKGNLDYGNKETDVYYLKQIEEFKSKWPHIKVMISVYNENEFNGFPRAAIDLEFRKNFARSSIEFLKEHNLDGIDLDWEFPNFPNTFKSREYEKIGLTKIVQTIRTAIVENFFDRQVAELNEIQKTDAFHNHYSSTHINTPSSQVEPYLLTVAIAGQESILRASYQLQQLASLCDWFNVMSYDYYLFKTYIPFTGPNSPLHPIVNPQVPILSKLSLSWTLQRLLRSSEDSIPANKIVVGIPTYARAYRLLFKQSSSPAPFTLALGPKGGQISDYLNYREVREILRRPETIVEFDSRARVPYCLTDHGYTWISYENEQSVREKVRFVLENQLAGYMTWNLNSDDFLGSAAIVSTGSDKSNQANGLASADSNKAQDQNSSSFPLHRAMLDELRSFVGSSANERKTVQNGTGHLSND